MNDYFRTRVTVSEGGCWEWTGSRTSAGYGNLRLSAGRWEYAHRLSYEAFVGAIPDGLTIDHLCRVRHCCNPEHLEPVTIAENIRRAAAVKVACPHGHPYDDENTYRSPRGERRCRTCARQLEEARRTPNWPPTHCPAGHEFTEANTYRNRRHGHRQCRECNRARGRLRYAEKKGVAA